MWRIERFVTRVDRFQTRSERSRERAGAGARQTERTWGLDQVVDRKQALRMVTSDAAFFI